MERFESNIESYKSGHYNETQVRREFVDPFFKAQGWDIDNEQGFAETFKDVINEGAFIGKLPYQAALKAANRGYTDIRLQERGNKKVHLFEGKRVQVDEPQERPSLDAGQDLEA